MNIAGEMIGMYGNTPLKRSYFQLAFLMQVLQKTKESSGNQEEVYPLLQAHLDLVDDNFAQVLRSWATAYISKAEPEQAPVIAGFIGLFSNLIKDFPLGSRTNNVEIALTGYEVVATVFTREAFPHEWAETINNLGNAYFLKIRGDRAENLEQAIAAYQEALQVHTRELFPKEWARIHTNLGNAYQERIRGDRTENLEQSIAAYQAALQVYTRSAFPEEWATIQLNMGTAYCNRIGGDRAQNLEAAIAAYQYALQVHTRAEFPEIWALTQNNLGTVYNERILGDQAQNLDDAIAALQEALQVRTPEAFPQDWAQTQNNLGNAYSDRGHISDAIACYRLALEVYKPTAFPVECFGVGRNLGNLLFAAFLWAKAIEVYGKAIDAVEQSRVWASTDNRRKKILEDAINVYTKIVQACIKNNDQQKALEYVERSKARNLVELLATRDLYPKWVSQEVRDELDRGRQQIRVDTLWSKDAEIL